MTQIKNNLLKVTLQLAAGVVCIAFVLALGSCNKDFANRLKTSSGNDTAGINVKQRRVLYIILDGVRGQAVRALAPTNITQIVNKAIYTYDGLTDFGTNTMTNAGAWSNMTTGVTKDQHKVISENFAGNQIAAFPSLFTRFKQLNPTLRTVSIAASGVFNANLAVDATNSQTFENDDASVKNAVVTELQKNDPNILVAQFHSAELAGQLNGYTNTTTQYNAAITTLDGYIGEINAALIARKTIAKEDWLVVIASNKGGAIPVDPLNTDKSIYSDASRNGLIIFYNPRFLTQVIAKPASDKIPYSGTAPNFTGNNSLFTSAVLGNITTGNFAASGEFVIQLKVRADHASTNYPPFLGKTTDFKNGNAGWVLFSGGDNWTFKANGTTQVGGSKIRDGIWHSIAFKIYNSPTRKITLYQDGVIGSSLSLSGLGNFDSSTAALTMGHIFSSESNGTIDVLIKELAIFNVAIPDADILKYMRLTTLTPVNNPYYANLVGYWPCDEGANAAISDRSGKSANFAITGAAKWKVFSDYSPNLDPLIGNDFYTLVINDVDIPYQIYQWMGVIVQPTWQLVGKTWKPTYTDVRNL